MSGAKKRELQKGDMIEFFRGAYNHWAVYVGDDEVVHVTNDSNSVVAAAVEILSVSGKSVIKREKLLSVAGKDKWKINNYLDNEYTPRPANVIVKEALALVGTEVPYSAKNNNCEHFATKMRYGKAYSQQAEDFKKEEPTFWAKLGALATSGSIGASAAAYGAATASNASAAAFRSTLAVGRRGGAASAALSSELPHREQKGGGHTTHSACERRHTVCNLYSHIIWWKEECGHVWSKESKAKKGDMIEIPRGAYSHRAVYVGDGEVVHVTNDVGSVVSAAVEILSVFTKTDVRREKLNDVAGKDKWEINNYLDNKYEPRPANVIVKEALAWVGKEVPYSAKNSNCEHFATKMRYGTAYSQQAEDFKKEEPTFWAKMTALATSGSISTSGAAYGASTAANASTGAFM